MYVTEEPTKGALKAALVLMCDEDMTRTKLGWQSTLGVARIIDNLAVRPGVREAMKRAADEAP